MSHEEQEYTTAKSTNRGKQLDVQDFAHSPALARHMHDNEVDVSLAFLRLVRQDALFSWAWEWKIQCFPRDETNWHPKCKQVGGAWKQQAEAECK